MSSGDSLSRTGCSLVTVVSTRYLLVSPVGSSPEKSQASSTPQNGLPARFFEGVFITIEEHRSDICCCLKIVLCDENRVGLVHLNIRICTRLDAFVKVSGRTLGANETVPIEPSRVGRIREG
jgi:hypothetical protein